MGEVIIIGVDLAKSVFQLHGAGADGTVVFRRKLRRSQVLPFFAEQPVCTVVMEACASAHHWARAIGAFGHDVKLIPPAYVKPFVKRQKNDVVRYGVPNAGPLRAPAHADDQRASRPLGRVRDRRTDRDCSCRSPHRDRRRRGR